MLIYDFLLILLQTYNGSYQLLSNLNIHMSYKITVKIAQNQPLLLHQNQLSEVQINKKKSLYHKPQTDKQPIKKTKTVSQPQKRERPQKSNNKAVAPSLTEQENHRKAQKQMMQDLDKMSKNQISLDMIRNNNDIQRRQNQILQENQKAIYSLVKNSQPQQNEKNNAEQMKDVLKQVIRQVDQIRKMRDEIMSVGRQLTKAATEQNKAGKKLVFQGTQNVTEMNSNLRNLAEVSKNQLEGLQNLQAIKNLQNFNIQNYTQSINALKKQIVQYQKESQNIERELKLRAAKLQKLQFNPNINEKVLVPYQNYLKKKADSIDMHALREKVYQKLGLFDYAKFEDDVNHIMAEVKGQLNQFSIICKQYRVQAPDIKIDPKQLKNLDIKLTSALQQYKAERGISFIDPNVLQTNQPQISNENDKRVRRKGQAIVSLKGNKRVPKAVRQLNTKPLDLATQVKLNKPSAQNKTVLLNKRQNDKKQVQKNIKKGGLIHQDDFDKFLENRANEELQQLYKQKRARLQKQKKQLYHQLKEEPQLYINLNLNNQIQKDNKKKTEPKPKIVQKQQIPEQQNYQQLKPVNEAQAIKSIGTQILKQKLKAILGKHPNQNRNHFNEPNYRFINAPQRQQLPKLQSMAENFINLINNTLTQVNDRISQNIQNKYEQRSLSKQKQYQKRSPPKITIPKLEQFRPPPTFNMPYSQVTEFPSKFPQKRPQPKLEPKDYKHLKIEQEYDENYQKDLRISSDLQDEQ